MKRVLQWVNKNRGAPMVNRTSKKKNKCKRIQESPIKSHIVEDSQVPGPSGIPALKLNNKTKTPEPEDY